MTVSLNALMASGLLCRSRLKNLELSRQYVVLSTQLLAFLCRSLCPLYTQTGTPGSLSYLALHLHLKAMAYRAQTPASHRGGHHKVH